VLLLSACLVCSKLMYYVSFIKLFSINIKLLVVQSYYRFMYLRPHYLKNAPGPPQILPKIQDGGQKSNMAAKMHKIVLFRANFVDI